MWLEHIDFWGREALDNIRRNRLMSLLAITTVTIGLFILGAFYLTIYNVSSAAKDQTQKLDLVIFLKKDIPAKRRDGLLAAVGGMPQVAKVQLATGKQVYDEAKTSWLKGVNLGDMDKMRPFSDELRIKLKDPEDLFKVRAYLTKLKGVESARSDAEADEAAHNLLAFNRYVTIAGLVALVVLGLAILLIIHNAIRLTVYARRREIRIMQLVGATPGFIRIPFLLEGLVYGLLGSLFASLALGVLCALARTSTVQFVQSLTPPAGIFADCSLLLMAAGLFFGVLGAAMSFSHSQKVAGV